MPSHPLRRLVAAICTVAVAGLGACSTDSDRPADRSVDGKLQATAALIDERVRNGAGGGPIGAVADIEAHLVHLMDRNVVPASFRFSYSDRDGDGVADDGRIELDDGNGNKVCLTFGPDASTPGRFTDDACDDGPLPLNGPSTVPAPSSTSHPAGDPATPTTLDRPHLPGGAGRAADAADQAVADDLARRLGTEAVAVARMSGTRPDATSVLSEVRAASLPDGAQMVFTDTDDDGVADGSQVSVVATNGVGACLVFTPDPQVSAGAC